MAASRPPFSFEDIVILSSGSALLRSPNSQRNISKVCASACLTKPTCDEDNNSKQPGPIDVPRAPD